MRTRELWVGMGLSALICAGCPASDDAPSGDGGAPVTDAAAGSDTGRNGPGDVRPADTAAASGCLGGVASDPVNLVSAQAVLDGRTILLAPTCIRAEVGHQLRATTVPFPTFFANRQSGPDDYAQIVVEINPDRMTALPTCDIIGSQQTPGGAGHLSFESTDVRDSTGKVDLVESLRGGTFTVTQYGDTVGARVTGTFDCPLGNPGRPARGSITGSFDVRIQ